jgi:hypothetical protein
MLCGDAPGSERGSDLKTSFAQCPRWERYSKLASTLLTLICPERRSATLSVRRDW